MAKSIPIALPQSIYKITLLWVTALSFVAPFLLGHPQFLVGSLVNMCLFLAVLYLPKQYTYPVILLPSIAVISRGLIFGPFTPFLLYMVPFVWAGNWILTSIFKLGAEKNFWFALFSASFVKFVFLFGCAFLLVQASIIPALFMQTMGVFQLITALSGGLAAFTIKTIYARNTRA